MPTNRLETIPKKPEVTSKMPEMASPKPAVVQAMKEEFLIRLNERESSEKSSEISFGSRSRRQGFASRSSSLAGMLDQQILGFI